MNKIILKLYVFKLSAEEIHNHFVVSRRLENKRRGYQRIVKRKNKRNSCLLSGKSSDFLSFYITEIF